MSSETEDNVANLRTDRLDLDNLHGGPFFKATFANQIVAEKLLHHPVWKAKLRLGTSNPIGPFTVEKPDDLARDVHRLGRFINSGTIERGDIGALSEEWQAALTKAPGEANRQRAIIGDGRNDEDSARSQTHLALAQFHNICVIHAHTIG